MQHLMRKVTIAFAPTLLVATMVSRAQNIPTVHHPLIPAISMEGSAGAAASRGGEVLSSVPTLKYDQGDPTADEQYMLELINRARANPAAEGVRLATATDPDITGNYNYFQVDTALLRQEFATYPSRPPLAFNAELLQAARLHTNDMATNNFQSHVGSNGFTFDKRIGNAGYTGIGRWIGENIFAYGTSIWHCQAAFLVDWGNPELGHRHNLLNFGSTDSIATEIGIGLKNVPSPQPGHVGPVIVTQDLGNLGRRFVTGVVYNDKNNNNFYDQGEGMPNITITPSQGAYYAITTASGGYSIPMTGVAGSVTFTATGAGLAQPITKELTITGPNIKLDFTPGEETATVSQVFPANGAVVRPPQLRLTWTSTDPSVDRYRWVLATDMQLNNIIDRDTAATDTSTTVDDVSEGGTYYWRVAAHNASGWGVWSEVRSFRLLEIPATVQLAGPVNGGAVTPASVRFWWKRSSGTTANYRFELATDMGMANLVKSDSALPDTSILVTGLLADRTYYWRVSAGNDAGWSPYSEVWSVRTGTSSVPHVVAGENGTTLTAEPNPATDRTTFRLNLADAGTVLVQLFGRDGQLLTTLVNERMPAGSHAIGWITDGTSAGLYFYRLTINGALIGTGSIVVE